MGEILGVLLTVVGCAVFSWRRSLRYLSALQQDEYAADRFLLWYRAKRTFDKKGSALCLACYMLAMLATSVLHTPIPGALLGAAACVGLCLLACAEIDPRRQGKVRLVLTSRALRILWVHCVLITALFAGASVILIKIMLPPLVPYFLLLGPALFQLLPWIMIASAKALQPLETSMQQMYLKDARRIIRESGSYIIGITGSYGKTSTKNALGEVLQISLGSTFWPTKGVNTLMGNTREIRERLTSAYRYAIIEMAAYRRGSIARLCELAPPRVGIITAIGMMHLERFGSLDEIYSAKTELARAIPSDGVLVCNGDDPGARRAAAEFPKQTTLLYGFSDEFGAPDCRMTDIVTTPEGSRFTLQWKGTAYRGFTGLVGRPALSNLMAVFTTACALGADPVLVLAALHNLKPVDNRLSLEKAGEVLRLKDAYNSNPVGFEAALAVLREMPAKKRILMTPGMIELGSRQEEENEKAAREAGKICDEVIVVGDTNRSAFERGLSESGFSMNHAHFIAHRDDALHLLGQLETSGDVTLIENDLSDWYEEVASY